MPSDDQQDSIHFLTNPASHAQAGAVETIDTHISRIFLVGDRAYKMKRAIQLPYADFSTPALRRAACDKEIELNGRTAPKIYLGVRHITREADGSVAFDGRGELIDAVVEMQRFEQSALLDRMAQADALSPALMTATARNIAAFHSDLAAVHGGSGADNMRAVLDINRAGFATSTLFEQQAIDALEASSRAALAHHAGLLDQRERAGKVRRCHGDLHLRNICVLDGEPCLFDCIEFNERIATIDVLYDLAFLLMDLWHRGLPEYANLVMNRYLDASDDEAGVVLLPFFMAVRATIRAHVTATQVAEDGDAKGKLEAQARAYFALAESLLHQHPARLIAIGGLSGSGKTTIAEALAAHVGAAPGARIVESDRVRKALHAVPAETRLPDSAYRPEVSAQVYHAMVARAGRVLAAGGPVVANAVFDRLEDREWIAQAAVAQERPFLGVWLDANHGLLRQRVDQRRGGPSDATVAVLEQQLEKNVGAMHWRRLDAAASPADIVRDILALPLS